MPARFLSFIKDYKKIEKPVKNAIASEFFIQMVNATFMNILPLYMTRKGFTDEEIALFITFRFLGVFVLAFPLGRFIKGKKTDATFLSVQCLHTYFRYCHRHVYRVPTKTTNTDLTSTVGRFVHIHANSYFTFYFKELHQNEPHGGHLFKL